MRPTWIAAIVTVVLAAGVAVYSVDSIGSTASNFNSRVSTPNDNSSSPSSSVYSSSTIQSTIQSSSVSSTSSLSTTKSTSTALNTTSSLNPTESTSASPSIGLAWFGAEGAPGSCSNELKDGAFGGSPGYTTTIYLTPTPQGDGQFPIGSTICIHTYLENTGNQSTTLPSTETVKITSVIDEASSGLIFYEGSCSVPGNYTGSFGPNSSAWNCVSNWDTSKPYDGNVPTASGPNSYEAIVTITMADSYVIQGIFSIDLAAPNG